MPEQTLPLLPILLITMGLGLLVFLVVVTTSFVKIAVVLFIVRNALGIQQTPPNLVIYGITLSLSAFVMAPVIAQMHDAIVAETVVLDSFQSVWDALLRAKEPLRLHLERLAQPEQRILFVEAAARVWPEEQSARLDENGLAVLIPSYLVTELERAFQIGFMLYLPFIIIDLVVTTILMAMGMSMVTPTVISTPMKLFLFVVIDGWGLLVDGLVTSYAV